MRHIKTNPFYLSAEWQRLRREVLSDDRYECQDCKARGKYSRANTVHHVKYLERYPELALSKFYFDEQGKQQRNLVSLCHECHETRHGYRNGAEKESLTEERW